MRSPLIATLVGAAIAAAVVTAAPATAATGVIQSMACIAPGDAGGIDAMLQRAGSPLAGEGATFVREGTATGIDPRALVAIAAHETILETYGPAQAIRNPFGLGPNWSFASEADAIARAASTLATMYIPEGRTAIPQIGAKWAPIGASNDPAGLNDNWTAGVGAYYAAMGGDPARPILLQAQDAAPACSGGGSAPAATDPLATTPSPAPAPAGPPVVVAWGGAAPAVAGPAAAQGSDPATGAPAVLDGFVFPLALAPSATASYRDAFAEPGTVDCAGARLQCALTIQSAPGDAAVAMVAGHPPRRGRRGPRGGHRLLDLHPGRRPARLRAAGVVRGGHRRGHRGERRAAAGDLRRLGPDRLGARRPAGQPVPPAPGDAPLLLTSGRGARNVVCGPSIPTKGRTWTPSF